MQATVIVPPGSYQESKVAVSLDIQAANSGRASLRMMSMTPVHPVHSAKANRNYA